MHLELWGMLLKTTQMNPPRTEDSDFATLSR
jgi:hypothetical protein